MRFCDSIMLCLGIGYVTIHFPETNEQFSSNVSALKTLLARGLRNLSTEERLTAILNERSRICELKINAGMQHLLIAERRP